MVKQLFRSEKFWTNFLFYMLLALGILGIGFALYCNVTGFEISFTGQACMFPLVLHIYCPGCGGTRAVRALLQGDLVRSFMCHPLVLYIVVLYLQAFVMSAYSVIVKRDGKMRVRIPMWQVWMLLVIVLGFFIFRIVMVVAFHYDYLGEVLEFWETTELHSFKDYIMSCLRSMKELV